jgi:hypothetical protein
LARLKQLKREARLRRKFQEDQKASIKAVEERVGKEEEINEVKDQKLHLL